MPDGDLGPLFFYFWASVTWCLNACFTHHKHHKNQLDESDGGERQRGEYRFLYVLLRQKLSTALYKSAGQVIGFVTSRETRGSWQLSWNVIKRELCCGTTCGPGKITLWEWLWSRQVGMAHVGMSWLQEGGLSQKSQQADSLALTYTSETGSRPCDVR